MNTAPPIGLMPRKHWIELRIMAIHEAQERYAIASKRIPDGWRHELRLLETELHTLETMTIPTTQRQKP